MLTHAITNGGCAKTVKEPALKSGFWEKIPCCLGVSSLRQNRAGPDAQATELHPRSRAKYTNTVWCSFVKIHPYSVVLLCEDTPIQCGAPL